MPSVFLRIVVFVPLFSIACSKKVTSESSGAYTPAVLSADAVPSINYVPTRPLGGAVEGKGQAADPEEIERRRQKNIVQPIIFGKSVAGITMDTRLREARSTLAFFSRNQGIDFYSEHLRILWKNGDDPTPGLIGIDVGYAGKLSAPAPYGQLSLGQSMDQFLSTESDLKKFMLALGAQFEAKGPDYNCELALTCKLVNAEGSYNLDFVLGGLRISKASGLPLSFIYFTVPQKFFARPTDSIVNGLSIAGATFQTKRANFEQRVEKTDTFNDAGFEFYDQESVGIRWSFDGYPTAMQAIGSYQGTLDFGAVMGKRKIGDSFSAYAPSDDDGTELIKIIDRALNNRPSDFDCLSAVPVPLCAIVIDSANGRVFMKIDRSSFLFSSGPERLWQQYLITAP